MSKMLQAYRVTGYSMPFGDCTHERFSTLEDAKAAFEEWKNDGDTIAVELYGPDFQEEWESGKTAISDPRDVQLGEDR